jgi:hypothetical protein
MLGFDAVTKATAPTHSQRHSLTLGEKNSWGATRAVGCLPMCVAGPDWAREGETRRKGGEGPALEAGLEGGYNLATHCPSLSSRSDGETWRGVGGRAVGLPWASYPLSMAGGCHREALGGETTGALGRPTRS